MTAAFWDQRSREYDTTIKKHDADFCKTIDKSITLLSASDLVLDFGCASGEFALDIAPHVRKIQGIDSSRKMISLATQKAEDRGSENVKFDLMTVSDIRLKQSSYSAILAFNIIHLMRDPDLVLHRLNHLLIPDGLLISQTPCLGDWGWLERSGIGLASRFGVAPHINELKAAELEHLIFGAKFEITESTLWDENHKVQWVVARKAGGTA